MRIPIHAAAGSRAAAGGNWWTLRCELDFIAGLPLDLAMGYAAALPLRERNFDCGKLSAADRGAMNAAVRERIAKLQIGGSR